jgi:hypothetical protein
VLGAAQRKQLHHHCNKYHLQSSSSGPEGQRRMTGQLRTGFQTKRCVRGTPSLKGMHLHSRAPSCGRILQLNSGHRMTPSIASSRATLRGSAKVFGVLTSMRHCEELERRAQETVATNNALNTCACPSGDEHTEGFRAYGAGASTATDSELRHAASRSACTHRA